MMMLVGGKKGEMQKSQLEGIEEEMHEYYLKRYYLLLCCFCVCLRQWISR